MKEQIGLEKDPIYLFRENDNGKFITGEKVEVMANPIGGGKLTKKVNDLHLSM